MVDFTAAEDQSLQPVFSTAGLKYYLGVYQKDVDHLNRLVQGTENEDKSLEDLIAENSFDEDPSKLALFNYASQVYNHSVFLRNLTPNGSAPSRLMNFTLCDHFGSVERFERVFAMNASAIYGSGWTWLVSNDKTLEVVNGFNAGNPVGKNKVIPLMCVNVWQHAYLMDFRLNRIEYIDRFLRTINWKKIEERLNSEDATLDLLEYVIFKERVDRISGLQQKVFLINEIQQKMDQMQPEEETDSDSDYIDPEALAKARAAKGLPPIEPQEAREGESEKPVKEKEYKPTSKETKQFSKFKQEFQRQQGEEAQRKGDQLE